MKTRKILLILIIISFKTYSQDLKSILGSKEMNYFETDVLFKKDTNNLNTLSEHDLEEYARWEWFWRTRIDEQGSLKKYNSSINSYNLYSEKKLHSEGTKSGITFYMECLGPYSIDNWMGRGLVTKIWVNPSDFDHIRIGTNNGGLWETENGGDNWICITDNSNYFIGGIADFIVSDDDSDEIIILSRIRIGTSHLVLTGRMNLGIYKTDDGGANWNSINFPSIEPNDVFIKILQIPNDENGYMVLTNWGLYKTINGGNDWTKISISTTDYWYGFRNMLFADENLVVSGKNFLKKSDDLGSSWDDIRNGSDDIVWDQACIDVAYDTNIDRLYAFYTYSIGDINYDKIEYTTNYSYWNPFSTQDLEARDYVQHIAIAPNSDVFAGGINAHKRQYGSSTFTNTFSGIHADLRDLYFPDPSNSNLVFIACDGGIAKSNNAGANWEIINGDLVNNEFYSIAVTPQDPEFMIGGLHDNHSYLRYSTGGWHEFGGGDGSTCLIDPTDINTYFWCSQEYLYRGNINNKIFSYDIVSWPRVDIPVTMNPLNPSTLYLGDGGNLYRSYKRGDRYSWSLINSTSKKVMDIAVAESDTNIVYYSSFNWDERNPLNPNPQPGIRKYNGSTWTDLNLPSIPMVPITDIDVESNDEDHIWISVGGFDSNSKIYRSVNGGSSWSNHTETGLPDFPVQCMIYAEENGILFAGTDVGLFWKDFYAYEWEQVPDFPPAIVTELVINSLTNELVISTLGRGIWRIDLDRTFCQNIISPINSTQTWNTDMELCSDLIINSGGKLTIFSYIEFLGRESEITVNNSAELIIDGGIVENTGITVKPGGKLTIKNDGKVKLAATDNCNLESGSIIEILWGSIEMP